MPKVGIEVLSSVQNALEIYKKAVEDTSLKPTSKETYLRHAEHFVRWLADDFDPGATLQKESRKDLS